LTIHTLSSLIRIWRILICPFSEKLPSSIHHSTLDDFSIQPKQFHQIAFLFIKEETFKIETVNNIDQQLLTDWENL
ncbi:hypothetical protein T11_15243, partial [Trichinella zimbabwensis]